MTLMYHRWQELPSASVSHCRRRVLQPSLKDTAKRFFMIGSLFLAGLSLPTDISDWSWAPDSRLFDDTQETLL